MSQKVVKKLDQKTTERLKEIGVFVHSGGFGYDSIVGMLGMRPVCAIWHESEEPTDEEITVLREIVAGWFGSFDKAAERNFMLENANMVTVNKENGKWKFRRLTWSIGPRWMPQEGVSIKDLKKEILHK